MTLTDFLIAFGLLMILMGVILTIKPALVFKQMEDNADSLWLHVLAVIVRLVLGVALIIEAPTSKFPLTIEVLGWIAIIAALVFMVIGRARFKRLINWAISLVPKIGRLAGLFAIIFGGFIVYTFI